MDAKRKDEIGTRRGLQLTQVKACGVLARARRNLRVSSSAVRPSNRWPVHLITRSFLIVSGRGLVNSSVGAEGLENMSNPCSMAQQIFHPHALTKTCIGHDEV